jgi:hypothetical protein
MKNVPPLVRRPLLHQFARRPIPKAVYPPLEVQRGIRFHLPARSGTIHRCGPIVCTTYFGETAALALSSARTTRRVARSFHRFSECGGSSGLHRFCVAVIGNNVRMLAADLLKR